MTRVPGAASTMIGASYVPPFVIALLSAVVLNPIVKGP